MNGWMVNGSGNAQVVNRQIANVGLLRPGLNVGAPDPGGSLSALVDMIAASTPRHFPRSPLPARGRIGPLLAPTSGAPLPSAPNRGLPLVRFTKQKLDRLCQKVWDSLGTGRKLFSCGQGKVPKPDKMMPEEKAPNRKWLDASKTEPLSGVTKCHPKACTDLERENLRTPGSTASPRLPRRGYKITHEGLDLPAFNVSW